MKYLVYLIFPFIISSCAVKVHSSYDESVDFKNYKTFCWLSGCEFTYTGPAYLQDEEIREKIKAAIIAELERKGFVNDENNPDLLVDFHISIENETSVIYHHSDDDQYSYEPFPQEEIINYLKGTIVIDIVDKAQSKMIWRSESIGYMDVHPELTDKNIQKGISSTLKNFPPKK